MKFYDTAKTEVHKHYEDDFFEKVDVDSLIEFCANTCRLQVMIQYFNIKFASIMMTRGSKFIFSVSEFDDDDDNIDHDIKNNKQKKNENCKSLNNYSFLMSHQEAVN